MNLIEALEICGGNIGMTNDLPVFDPLHAIHDEQRRKATVLVFDCCGEYRVLPAKSTVCPACGDLLEDPIECVHCRNLATRLETFMTPGETSRCFASEVSEPRCNNH